MTLAVLGDPQAVAAAGYAAARTSERVLLGPSAGPLLSYERTTGLYDGPVEVRGDRDPEADAYLLVCTSQALPSVVERYREQLAGRALLLAPGGFGGAVRVRRLFEAWGLEAPLIGETTGFPVMGAAEDETIKITSLKRQLPLAGPDDAATATLLEIFGRYFDLFVASNLATTSLSNTNHMLHPAITLTNAARIARGDAFTFYREGITPELNGLIGALDAERLAVVRALGGEELGVTEWMLRFYGGDGMQGSTIIDCLAGFAPFARSKAPTTLDHRYLTDDVPYGAAAHLAVAEALGLEAPVNRAVVTTAGLLLGRDLSTPAEVVDDFLTAARHHNSVQLAR
ncbi:NAD/NADP octopine/nopaline dehydrogenase family protein [Propionibacteriaceae bacterium Y1700]|uniref:NAD/NADP octopine/nopaline dehydrogenase family protein n=1 Tax=Microlunatus sp. Y1700 TaxID=3418487 RepID=UPI003DA6EDF4